MSAIAQHAGLDGHLLAQFLHRPRGAVFLREAEQAAAGHDGQDNRGVQPFPDRQGDGGGE
ncbi:MAG: hypothetical protein ACSLE5_08085 [Porticoccaceae bacterium]